MSLQSGQRIRGPIRQITLGLMLLWLFLVACLGWWASQWIVSAHLERLAASAEYETQATARVVNRLFTEMVSVTNMVARQSRVIELATRYRTDPPGMDELTRQERAAQFMQDPLARQVGDTMNALAHDLGYARIYMTNMSDDTVTASNWAEPDSIVGMIYSGRSYLSDALEHGNGHLFGIARLLKTQSYFVGSRIDDAEDKPLGVVTMKFDAPDMALYLAGQHTSLIVNRQGRVTTTSSPSFMLRNVAPLLPQDMVLPPDNDEDPGEPMNVRLQTDPSHPDRWLIEGKPYLLLHHPLSNAQYKLLTLVGLDHLKPMSQQHFLVSGLIAVVGLVIILLSSHVVGQMLVRRQDERYAANHDALTGLPNRRAILRELERLFVLAKQKRRWILVAFIDLDEFKAINDTYGHEAGDKFLIEVAKRMSSGLRTGDMLGRLGGDEFVVIGLVNPASPGGPDAVAKTMGNRLRPLLIGTYHLQEHDFEYAGASLGIACVDPSDSSLQNALNEADQQMYAEKQARKESIKTAHTKSGLAKP